MRIGGLSLALLAAACGASKPPVTYAREAHVIDGTFAPERAPDGNSIFLDAPRGLIVVDTGRHPEHQAALVAHAQEILAAYPGAEVIATRAIEGAIPGFLLANRPTSKARVESGDLTPEQIAEVKGDWAAVDSPAPLKPTRPVTASGPMDIAGRTLDVHVAPFAATEADLWLLVEETGTVIAGDLVVPEVPFLDTACPDGWQQALAAIAATRFERLVPGHGATMTRAQFDTWRAAFDHLLACASTGAPADTCIAGWMTDAAAFIPAENAERTKEMLGYYIAERLRSAEARAKYCAPLGQP